MTIAFKMCAVTGCLGNSAKATYGCGGFCRSHYARYQRYGSPTAGSTYKGDALDFINTVALVYEGDDCLIWPHYRNPYGYGEIRIHKKLYYAHRLICEKLNGPPPSSDHQAAHSCGNGHLGCVSPKHVRWATRSENQMDRVDHQTDNRGDRNHFDKLTEADVIEIRRLHGTVQQKDLAALFNVTKSNIQAIQYRKSWAWLA